LFVISSTAEAGHVGTHTYSNTTQVGYPVAKHESNCLNTVIGEKYELKYEMGKVVLLGTLGPQWVNTNLEHL
jgi:hypothetical protein